MKPTRYLMLLPAAFAILALFCSMAVPFTLAAPGQSAETLFQQGNDLYGQGRYQEALQVYENIIAENGFSGPLLYNLANCYAQTGRTGLAVLNYERALRLSPGDSDSRGNLDLLQKNQGLFQEELPLARRMISILDLDQWTLLAGLSLLLLTFIALAGLRLSSGRQLRRWTGGAGLLLLAVASTGAFCQYRQLDEAVVTGSDAHLLLSPFPGAAAIATIREGRKVRFLQTHGAYALVEDKTGHSGWIETNAVEGIIAPGSLNPPAK